MSETVAVDTNAVVDLLRAEPWIGCFNVNLRAVDRLVERRITVTPDVETARVYGRLRACTIGRLNEHHIQTPQRPEAADGVEAVIVRQEREVVIHW